MNKRKTVFRPAPFLRPPLLLAVAALVSAILGNLIYYGMMFGRGEVMKEYMMSNANMNATIVEYVNGMEVIKAFNQTASSMGRFQSAVLKASISRSA